MYVIAVFITLKSILAVDLLGLDKLTTAYGILSLLEGVGSLAGTPLIGNHCFSSFDSSNDLFAQKDGTDVTIDFTAVRYV